MDKQNFLNKLHKSLRRTFTKQEIRDIIADYEGFFISGANDGKSEEEICIELGDPAAVALELMQELPQPVSSISLSKDILIKIFAAALTLFGFSYYFIIYSNYNLIRDGIVLFVVFAVVLLLALYVKRSSDKSGKTQIIILSAGHIFLLVIVIMIDTFIKELLYYAISLTPLTPKPNTIIGKMFKLFKLADIEYLTNFLATIVYTSAIVFLLIAITAVLGFYRSTPLYFTLLIHAAGALNYIGGVYRILNDMQDMESFTRYMDASFKIYCVSIGMALIFIPYLLSRRSKK